MIKFRCTCGKILSTSDENAGKKAQCSNCKRVFRVPIPKYLETKKSEDATQSKSCGERFGKAVSARKDNAEIRSRLAQIFSDYKQNKLLFLAENLMVLAVGIAVIAGSIVAYGFSLLYLILELAGVFVLDRLLVFTLRAIKGGTTAKKLEALLSQFGVNRQTLLATAVSIPLIAEDYRFLFLIDRKHGLFAHANRQMSDSKIKFREAYQLWYQVGDSIAFPRNEPKDPESKTIFGISRLWLALFHLMCAEEAKMVLEVEAIIRVTGAKNPGERTPLWPFSARAAVELAQVAHPYLEGPGKKLVQEIVERAKREESISDEEAKKHSRYKTIKHQEYITPGVLPHMLGSSELNALEFALAFGNTLFKVKDLVAWTKGFGQHAVVTQGIENDRS